MKNFILTVAVISLFSISAIADTSTVRTIEVTGTCTLSINPDIVKFNVDIESIANSLKAAKEKNDGIFKKLVASLKETGIAESDIELSGIQYNKHQEYQNGKYVHKGYKASMDLTIKLKDFSLFETVLSYMVENDDIKFSLGFDSTKTSAKKLEALKDALAKAKSKAEEMAAVYGLKVGAPLSIGEQGNSYNISVSNAYRAEDASSRSNLFNQITVDATVIVKFELK